MLDIYRKPNITFLLNNLRWYVAEPRTIPSNSLVNVKDSAERCNVECVCITQNDCVYSHSCEKNRSKFSGIYSAQAPAVITFVPCASAIVAANRFRPTDSPQISASSEITVSVYQDAHCETLGNSYTPTKLSARWDLTFFYTYLQLF